MNVGVGYAISINQVKRFITHLASGRIVDHASFGATVATGFEGGAFIDEVLETSDAYRRGLRYGDQIVRFGGREIHSANALKNALGTYPKGWTVAVEYLRDGDRLTAEVRLPGLHAAEALVDMVQKEAEKPSEVPPSPEGPKPDGDKPRVLPMPAPKPELSKLVREHFTEHRGYANYWYNVRERNRLWNTYLATSGAAELDETWKLSGTTALDAGFTLEVGPEQAEIRLPQGTSGAVFSGRLDDQLSPPGSGGLLLALHMWQRLLAEGPERFGEVYYLGALPLTSAGRPLDCLVGLRGGVEARFLLRARRPVSRHRSLPRRSIRPLPARAGGPRPRATPAAALAGDQWRPRVCRSPSHQLERSSGGREQGSGDRGPLGSDSG